MDKTSFRKKIYKKLDTSPLSEAIALPHTTSTEKSKKIVSSIATKNLREVFKKTFLPLLIDVFELRQMIENYRSDPGNKIEKSPKQILERLEEIQRDIEETQRWCAGVIVQIAKGIEEARGTLDAEEESFFKRLLRKMKR